MCLAQGPQRSDAVLMSCNVCALVLLNFRVGQSVMCLATDACLTADPGVTSSIPASLYFRGD